MIPASPWWRRQCLLQIRLEEIIGRHTRNAVADTSSATTRRVDGSTRDVNGTAGPGY